MEPGSTFFKVISHTTLAQRKMEIPRAIATSMQVFLANQVILRDRYKNLWVVEVDKDYETGGLYFGKGWMKLCQDYSLEMSDSFVFEYKGKNMFDFLILGINACEKECVRDWIITVKEEETIDEEDEDEEEEEEEDDEEEEEYEEEDEEEDDTDMEDSYDEDEVMNAVKEEEFEEEDDEQASFSRKVNLKSKPKSNHTRPGTSAKKQKRVYVKRTAPDWYGADLIKSGQIDMPKHPYFVSISRHHLRKNTLYIPMEVIRDNNLHLPDEAYIVDERGRKWFTKFKKWTDGRVWCGRGWKSFCRTNFVENDQICVCEFINGAKNELNIHVRVVPELKK